MEGEGRAQRLAAAAAAALSHLDRTKPWLGIEVEAVGPNRARLSMTVAGTMANGHGNAHGGMIFTLADAAFGVALNSEGEAGVSAECAITYLSPAKVGERLTALAEERARRGRTVLIDVRILGDDGRVVAEFRGHGRRSGGSIFALAGLPEPEI